MLSTINAMAPLVGVTPKGKHLTRAGQKAFISTYKSFCFRQLPHPVLRLATPTYDTIKELSKLRMKDWASTTRWNPDAEITGLLGELATFHFFGFSPEQALKDFKDGLSGDGGVDFHWAGEAVDVKTTRGQALKFRFNRTNKATQRATIILFSHLQEEADGVFVQLLGWAWRFRLHPWMRSDSRSDFVRIETLRREGVLQPVETLKAMQEGDYLA